MEFIPVEKQSIITPIVRNVEEELVEMRELTMMMMIMIKMKKKMVAMNLNLWKNDAQF